MERRASTTPFTRIRHALVVAVRVADAVETRFVLDTGIGIDLVSKRLADRLGLRTEGEMRGKRMSGQELTVPLARLRSLSMGTARSEDVEVGVFDLAGFPPAFAGIDGFLSLRFFEGRPFTIDYPRGAVVLETSETLAARAAAGTAVPLRLDREPHALSVFFPLDLSVGEPALVEVDTGSDALILDTRYMKPLGFDPAGRDVKTTTGTDETGHAFVRRFTTLRTPIFPVAAPAMRLENSPVMFQDVIHDGLVGDGYFKHFVVTYDLPASRLILARP
jgi:hypothetical protein